MELVDNVDEQDVPLEPISQEAETMQTTTLSTFCSAAVASLITSIVTLSPSASLWIVLHQFQSYILLILTRADIPDDVINYLLGFKFVLANLNFMNFDQLLGLEDVSKWLNIPQKYDELKIVEIESASSFTNNFDLL